MQPKQNREAKGKKFMHWIYFNFGSQAKCFAKMEESIVTMIQR